MAEGGILSGGAGDAAVPDGGKEKCTQKSAEKLMNAFDATAADGESTIYEMAGYLDLKPETVKKKLKGSDAFWVEDEKVRRKKTE